MKSVLVTGGAGYIGSHVVKLLGEHTDYGITVIDNLSTGKKEAVLYGDLIVEDVSNTKALSEIFSERKFNAIIHFAASIVVPESVADPLKYYSNNTINTINLIRFALENEVSFFIFSSTAAVYGMPEEIPIKETGSLNPINPYGMSKLMSERVLVDAAQAHHNLRYIILRYFNVAGASSDGKIGQNFPEATHLIKRAAQAVLGAIDYLEIYGLDYDTADGTGVRDYIHVDDLAAAHLSALDYLQEGKGSSIFNCGYGRGYSVQEVVDTMKKVTGVDFPTKESARRPGDPSVLVADNSKILQHLNWKPQFDDLASICKTAFEWEKKIA
ncbi:MAG: UDP-glucose 4-epimerase GalE [Deltaproteobacteria bacterium]|nr:UDP-glucose 4-epimerase GalE [Deltaproteobacteria bacterium]